MMSAALTVRSGRGNFAFGASDVQRGRDRALTMVVKMKFFCQENVLRETSNIYDGSAFTADMAVQVIGILKNHTDEDRHEREYYGFSELHWRRVPWSYMGQPS